MKLSYIQNKNLKALTLVEVIMYLALFGVIFATLIQFAITTSEYNTNNEIKVELEKSIVFVTEHISLSFKNNTSIDSANSTFDNNDGVLELDTSTNSNRYFIQAGRLVFFDGENRFLTSSDYTVNSFRVEEILSSKDNSLIGARINLDISSTKKDIISRSIQTAYVLK